MAWSLLAYLSRDTCLQSSDWGRNSNTSFSGVPFLLLPELPPLMSWIRQKMLWVFQFNIFGTLWHWPAIIILLFMDTPRSPHLLVGSFPEKRHFLAPATSISVESKYVSSIFFLIQCPVFEYAELEPGPKPSPPVTWGNFRKMYIFKEYEDRSKQN